MRMTQWRITITPINLLLKQTKKKRRMNTGRGRGVDVEDGGVAVQADSRKNGVVPGAGHGRGRREAGRRKKMKRRQLYDRRSGGGR